MTAQQISLKISAMGGSMVRFAASRQPDRVYDKDRYLTANLKGADGGRALIIAISATGSF